MNLNIKPFTVKDSTFLLKIRNQKTSRKNSINKELILPKDHNRWLSKFFFKKNNKIFIIYLSSTKVGYIRLEWFDFYYLISISIIDKWQNKGLALESFLILEKNFLSNTMVLSKIKSNNNYSIKLFKKLGFTKIHRESNILYFCKIYKNYKELEKSQIIINEIEIVRTHNNINWMDILRLAFKSDLEKSKDIFKKINYSDVKINKLSKKLSK